MSTTHLDTESLVSAYLTGEGASSLARTHKVSVWSIITRLRAAGVEIRTNQNERGLGAAVAAFSFQELVDGILLGDGGIDPKGLLRLEQCQARVRWLDQVQGLLHQVGSESRIVPIPPRERVLDGRMIQSSGGGLLYTPAYVEMQAQRRRWYPEGTKIVPLDLKLTPLCLAQWFTGDGTYDKTGTLLLCTQSFTRIEVEFLTRRFQEDLGVHASVGETHRDGQFTIRILRKNDAVLVRDMVAPWMPDCCQYKFQYVRSVKRMGRFSPAQVQDIRRRRGEGEAPLTLDSEYGVSKVMILKIASKESYAWVP
jgi:hypothetical protein